VIVDDSSWGGLYMSIAMIGVFAVIIIVVIAIVLFSDKD
jgi:hypothetical protein